MAIEKTAAATDANIDHPIVVRTIGAADLRDALAKGFDDFKARPTHLLFVCIIYPIAVLISARVSAGYEFLALVFPLIAGSTLLGPLAACGMYELSRRRELGLDLAWTHCFDVFRSPAIIPIAMLGES